MLSVRHLSSQLVELECMIDHMMREEFLRFCTHDLNRPLTEQRTAVDEVGTLTAELSNELYSCCKLLFSVVLSLLEAVPM